MAREIEQQDLSPSSGKKYSFKWLCFAPRELGFGKDVAELTGSLLNNTVHGVAKFKYTDNSTSIGRYHKGVLHGVRRMFSAENNSLQSVYNFRNGVKVGRGWRLENGHALLHVNYGQQPHHLDEEDEEMLAIINGTEVFSGRFQEFLLELQDLRRANIELLDLPSPNGDCIMDDIKWTSADKSERLPFIYSTEWKLEVPDGYRDQDFCKSDFKTPQLRLWEHLQQHHRSWSKSRPFFFGDQYPLHFMKSETMPVEPVEGKSVRVISNVTLVNMKRRRFTASLWGRPAQDIVIANARFNRNKQLQGTLNVYVVDFTSPETEGVEVPWLKGKRMTGFQGRFSDGVLKGIVKLYFSFSQLIFAEVEDGYLHGGMVSYGQSPVLPGNKLRDILTPGIRFLGHYRSGRAHGHFWHGCLGGGFYHGLIGDDGTVTGDEIAFIYPDMETAFLGKFENFVMKSAQEVEVLETRCDDYGMITVSKYTDPSGPVFYYEAPTNVSFGAGPPGVRDPFERKWVELSKSQIPGSGEGVILKQKPLGSMYVSLYCGYMYNLEQKIIYSQKCLHNTSLTDDHRRHCKKYSIGISFNNKQINIPPEIDMEGVFQPTLGQKVMNP